MSPVISDLASCQWNFWERKRGFNAVTRHWFLPHFRSGDGPVDHPLKAPDSQETVCTKANAHRFACDTQLSGMGPTKVQGPQANTRLSRARLMLLWTGGGASAPLSRTKEGSPSTPQGLVGTFAPCSAH